MNIFKRMFGNFVERRSAAPTTWDLLRSGAAIDSASGSPVTAYLAENLSVVFACVQLISETVAMLPLKVYRRMPDGSRKEDRTHPVAKLFSGDVNDRQPANEFIEMMTAHTLLRGQSYAEIVRDNAGQVTSLVPFHPDWVQIVRLPNSKNTNDVRYAYDISVPWIGTINGTKRLLPEEILIIRDRTDDGVVGKSRLRRAHETFGSALANERYAASVFKNGAAMSGVLSHPEALDEAAVDRLTKSFKNTYTGAENAGSVAVLEEGLKWTQVSVSPADAQILDSRRFSVEALARIFRVPPAVIGSMAGGGMRPIEEIGRWFYAHTMSPWLVRWERTIERSLFSSTGRISYEVEFDCDLLMRGNMLERFQAYRIAREIGLYNANELRSFEMQNPRTDPGGTEYFAPTNMQPEQTAQPILDRGGGIAAEAAG
jgi:HK97 family phage portal protein